MKNNYLKKIIVFGFIALLIMASNVPLISSTQNLSGPQENTTNKDEFSVEVTKPTRGLYINNEFFREFNFIRRGMVIGDITLEATAIDDVNGIDRVVFHAVGGWNNIQFTDEDEPYEANWTDWGPGLYHITATAWNTLNESVESINDIQIFKLG